MSIDAIHFIMRTEIADGVAKLVAFVLADYAHAETGHAWPKIETLARKCSQSVRTVQRKVRVLEELGILHVEQRHTDGGRQKENLYVLHLPGVTRPKARTGPKPPDRGGVGTMPRGDTQSPIEPPNSAASVTHGGDNAVTPVGDTAVTPRGIPQKESLRGIQTPLSPPDGGVGRAQICRSGSSGGVSASPTDLSTTALSSGRARPIRDAVLDPGVAELFSTLVGAYPEEGIAFGAMGPARSAFAELSAELQRAAIAAAPHYARFCRLNSRRVLSLHRWLGEGRFANTPRAADPAAAAASAPVSRPFVLEDTPAWNRWRAHLGRPIPKTEGPGGLGWYFDTEFPPESPAHP